MWYEDNIMRSKLFDPIKYLPRADRRIIRIILSVVMLAFMLSWAGSSPSIVYAAKEPMLNLSSIACSFDQVEVHFVVVNLPDNLTPGALIFYGTWPGGNGSATIAAPTQVSGSVYHYSFYNSDGYYEITGATVALSDGSSLNLHNPGVYTGTYQCHCFGAASCDGWEFHFMHPLRYGGTITVYAAIAGSWQQVGYGTVAPTTAPETIATGNWTAQLPSHAVKIKFIVVMGNRTHIEYATRPACTR
jgi:hypothetical protein